MDPRDMEASDIREILKFKQCMKGVDGTFHSLTYEAESILCVVRDPFFLFLVFYFLVSLGGFYISGLWYLFHLYDVAVFPLNSSS